MGFVGKCAEIDRFWEGKTLSYPLIGFKICVDFPSFFRCVDDTRITPDDLSPKKLEQYYSACINAHDGVEDDICYVADPVGFPWAEAIFGCEIQYSNNGFWPVEMPVSSIAQWNEKHLPALDLMQNKWCELYFEHCRYLSGLADGRCTAGQAVLRGSSDVHLAIRGENGILDYYDDAEQMHRFIHGYTCFIEEFIAVQNTIIGSAGYGIGSDQLPSRHTCIRLQQDAVTILSPDIYQQFLLISDKHLAKSTHYSMFHLHSSYLDTDYSGTLDDILRIEGLTVIQVTKDIVGTPLEELTDVLMKIQSSGKRLAIRGSFNQNELDKLLHDLDTSGLYLNINVASAEEANELYNYIHRKIPKQQLIT